MLILSYLLLLILDHLYGYKILVYNPRLAGSHTMFSGKIADILAEAGHDVAVYQPIFDEKMTKSGSNNKKIRFYELKNVHVPSRIFEQGSMLWEDDSFAKLLEVSF